MKKAEKLKQDTNSLTFNKDLISVVEIDEVRPNSWNPKDQDTEDFKKVQKSIEVNGLRLPIVVREKDGYEIIDGEQRWRSCKNLGYTKVIIYNEGQISDQKAKELTIWYQQQVPFNEVDLAHLVADLVKGNDFSVPFSQEAIDEFIQMTKFDTDSFEKAPVPEMPEQSIVTFSLPVTREQLEVIEQALERCVSKEGGKITRTRALELIMADYLSGA